MCQLKELPLFLTIFQPFLRELDGLPFASVCVCVSGRLREAYGRCGDSSEREVLISSLKAGQNRCSFSGILHTHSVIHDTIQSVGVLGRILERSWPTCTGDSKPLDFSYSAIMFSIADHFCTHARVVKYDAVRR